MILIDTNVLSELRKPVVDAGVRSWFDGVDQRDLFTSVLVLGEIRRGVERLRPRDPGRAESIDAWLGTLKQAFGDRVLGITEEVAETWGRIGAIRPLPAIDGLLAATALVHGATLVTRNLKDVEGTGVLCLSPFTNHH